MSGKRAQVRRKGKSVGSSKVVTDEYDSTEKYTRITGASHIGRNRDDLTSNCLIIRHISTNSSRFLLVLLELQKGTFYSKGGYASLSWHSDGFCKFPMGD